MKDDASKPVAQALYDKIVEPVNRKVSAEASQPEKRKKEQKTASSKSSAKDDKAKKQKSNEMAARIEQLNKEGRTGEAMALTMQMMQGQQGIPSEAIAEGAQDEDDRLALERTRADEKRKAYIQFLQELAKETAFKRQIIIEYKNTAPTSGG
jgi:transglutaminase/protease-like cytokinesis protein 3